MNMRILGCCYYAHFFFFQLIFIKFSLFSLKIFTLFSEIKLHLFWFSPFNNTQAEFMNVMKFSAGTLIWHLKALWKKPMLEIYLDE